MEKHKFKYTVTLHGYVDGVDIINHTINGEIEIEAKNIEEARLKVFKALKNGYHSFNYDMINK